MNQTIEKCDNCRKKQNPPKGHTGTMLRPVTLTLTDPTNKELPLSVVSEGWCVGCCTHHKLIVTKKPAALPEKKKLAEPVKPTTPDPKKAS